ncbi:hypothetical protein MX040_01090 [Serratia marcescens]|uniref:hypothetical protein n=1 Tax=Serratia marcescens TaxID=615 RepID=UPI001FF1805E|nr:hypothetical protein [Serratia marcescens]MCK1117979.1 hypothetical protein [Serratia marcescens]
MRNKAATRDSRQTPAFHQLFTSLLKLGFNVVPLPHFYVLALDSQIEKQYSKQVLGVGQNRKILNALVRN